MTEKLTFRPRKTNIASKPPPDTRITIRLTAGQYAMLQDIAELKGLSVSSWVRMTAIERTHEAFEEQLKLDKIRAAKIERDRVAAALEASKRRREERLRDQEGSKDDE